MDIAARRTFDRTQDVAKLEGCNTRNVAYRWDIFQRALSRVPPGAAVLDFGAGSLRDSYEMASRGYRVTAFDLNEATLKSYAADYNWTAVPGAFAYATDLREALAKGPFGVITAFDVFEHLEDPRTFIAQLREALAPGGMIFCTVPNRYTLFEILYRVHWKMTVARGRPTTPGEPHLQFKSPKEWAQFFRDCDLTVVEHTTAIGPIVNTWSALNAFPARALRKFTKSWPKDDLLAGPRVMAALNKLDNALPMPVLGGWNLMVLSR